MKKTDLPKKIPVFPLSNFIIFPKTTVPLNIFEPRYIEIQSCEDCCMEDVSFCLDCKDNNIPIYVDPQIKVIHCKTAYLK